MLILEFELGECHICQLTFGLIGRSRNTKLTLFDKGSGALYTLDLCRIKGIYDLLAVDVLSANAVILVTQVPILVKAVMRTVDETGHFLVASRSFTPVNDVSDVC